MDKKIFDYVERQIYLFEEIKREYECEVKNVLHYTPIQQEIRNLEPTKDAENRAIELVTNWHIKRLEQIVYAIQIALVGTSPDIRNVLQDKYWERPWLTWESIANQHYVNRRTVYRWRKGFVKDVAIRMGETR